MPPPMPPPMPPTAHATAAHTAAAHATAAHATAAHATAAHAAHATHLAGGASGRRFPGAGRRGAALVRLVTDIVMRPSPLPSAVDGDEALTHGIQEVVLGNLSSFLA